jgi:UDP-N-acetylmuramoylalanine--D-glutamate ligase
MKIAILGYDVEGRSSYDYFAARGHELVIHDRDEQLSIPEGAQAVLGFDEYLLNLDQYDLLVRTAGLPPERILEQNPSVADKITSHTNEFMRVCPTKNIIGVTGTKGKGTTSTLITKMLEAGGKDVFLGGNIGTPPLSFLEQITPESWVVLELSSFQLIDFKISPHISVCLMVVPEHLNWHVDMDEYASAKANLFRHQTSEDFAVYFSESDESLKIAASGPAQMVTYYESPGAFVEDGAIKIDSQTICQTSELKLLGEHNWQNACAAVTAVWQVQPNVDAARSVLTTFAGLEHRLELVRELNGVKYYDDSFGTAPETATVAIQAFTQPVIVILGGRTKEIPFNQLARTIAHQPHVKNVITIGETGPEIAKLLRAEGYQNITEGGKDMDAIVAQAQELAVPGDIVLLSPAATSFDMFKNYKDRGEQFSRAVQALA